MPVIPRDPRSRMKRFWSKREAMHLPVPKFKVWIKFPSCDWSYCMWRLPFSQYDQYYVGTILPKEVTFTNLNDNIQQQFLRDMTARFGNIEECKIFYHPVTKKHLGIAKVMLDSYNVERLELGGFIFIPRYCSRPPELPGLASTAWITLPRWAT